MKRILPLLVVLAIGCTKAQDLPESTCQRVYYLSDKYTVDTFFVRTDTLWPWGRTNNVFCNDELNQFRIPNDSFIVCSIQMYEVRRFVIGNIITHPRIYK